MNGAGGVDDSGNRTETITNLNNDRLQRNRKFKAFLLVLFLASAFMAFDKLTGEQWVSVVGIVYGAYMVGNVGEHWTKVKGGK